jgi:hypothetical protein
MGLSDVPGDSLNLPGMPLDYDDEPIFLGFTQAEIDMIYFALLAYIGHPQAAEYELKDDGFDCLLRGLTKIKEHQEEVDRHPTVVEPL